MFGLDITLETLHQCLANVEPVDLQGMRLLKACPTFTGLFPQTIPRASVKAAVIELVEYTQCCQVTAQRLSDLTPMPILAINLLEYGL